MAKSRLEKLSHEFK